MIRKLILLSIVWLPVQQPLAAIVDLELELYLTIDHIVRGCAQQLCR